MNDTTHDGTTPAGPTPSGGGGTDGEDPGLEGRVIEVLKTLYDPEIPVNIYELGLIYSVDIDDAGAVKIIMTLTSPMCPVAESLPPQVEQTVAALDGVSSARVEVVWEPPWNKDMISEAARLDLGID